MAKKKTKMPPLAQNVGIQVGVSEGSVDAARTAILEILESSADESTKVVALQTLQKVCNIDNTTLSHCNITL